MKLKFGVKPIYLREIEQHKILYKKKNLKYVKNNRVFYWSFLAYLEDIDYRPLTIARFYYGIDSFLKWLGKKSLRKVTKKDIEKYLLYIKNDCHHKPYMMNVVKQNISVFFSFVMRHSRMKVNPTLNLNIRIHCKTQENMDYFTQEEVVLILKKPLSTLAKISRKDFTTEYAYKKNIFTTRLHYLILKLMFSTGIRPCEIININLFDLNITKLTIRIRSKGCQKYIIKDRDVFITEKTALELQELINLEKSIRTEESESRLFIQYNGWKLANNYPNRMLKHWAQKCGITKRVYAYMARYTYCTRLVENGIDIYSLKKLMGHRNVEITLKHYLKLTESEIRKEWKIFNPLVKEENI